MKKLVKQNGITLIALVITIILMLILLGVTVTVALNGGLFSTAKKAVNETEIIQEKEIIKRAILSTIMINDELSENEFKKELNIEAGDTKVELSSSGENFEVYFEESNRYYEVNKDGIIGDYNTIQQIDYPGDITKGGILDGSEEKPYEINCIEDLVELSKNATTYSGKNYKLMRNLNFKSKFSYYDSDRTDYGDINEDGNTEILIKELTTGKGFLPIQGKTYFAGNFNGQGYEISNLMVNREYAGLFGRVQAIVLSNVGITGNLEGTTRAGGIIAESVADAALIENCYFKGNVKATDNAGGIIGQGSSKSISNCFAEGNIQSESNAGGILGSVQSSVIEIKNCYNKSNVYGKIAGGIVGDTNSCPKIYNCFNLADINSDSRAGGIVGRIYGAVQIKNVYNVGDIECSDKAGAIAGTALWNSPDILIENSFYLEGTAEKGTNVCTDTTTKYSKEQMKSENFIKDLNDYIDNNSDSTIGWLKWKLGEDGYQIFEQ